MNERPIAINHDTDIAYTLILFSKWEQDRGELLFKENKFRVSWSWCCFGFNFLTNYDYKESL